MFSRSGPQTKAEPAAASSAGPAEPQRSETARAFDQVMTELQPPGAPPTSPDVSSVTATAEEHASTLRATRDAHQEAQQLLAMATEARRAASEEAERIVLEARDAAERSRQEIAGWAAAQRAKVDALAADMIESANRDADTIRAEALRTSMAEAEESARAYMAEAAERAQRDADAVRSDARHVLNHARELGDQVSETIKDLTTTVADIMGRLQGAQGAMEQLLAEIPATRLDEPDQADQADDTDATAGGEATPPDHGPGDATGETGETGETPDEVAGGAGGTADEDDIAATVLADEPEETSESLNADDEEPVEADEPPPDRQLGSMFRRHGQRGY